jgi:hypothetical protein
VVEPLPNQSGAAYLGSTSPAWFGKKIKNHGLVARVVGIHFTNISIKSINLISSKYLDNNDHNKVSCCN